MGHNFKPVTTGEEIQVAILDELQQIKSLLEPSKEPAVAELPPEPVADAPAAEPEPAPKPGPVKKATAKKATTKKTVTGR